MSQPPQCGLHSFIYSCTTVRGSTVEMLAAAQLEMDLSPLWGGSTPPVCCSEIWSALLLSQPVLPLAVQTLNVRCGLSVPAQKSHCRFWFKWIEGSFFLRFGQRLPQQPFARVQPTKAFKTDSVMCGLSGELCHMMLLAVTSWKRRPLNVGMPTDSGQCEAYYRHNLNETIILVKYSTTALWLPHL